VALHVPQRVRRIGGSIAAVLAVVVLAGATYQGVATALERRQFQRPGGLVDIGAYQLHIYCIGKGSPTVILEAAAGSMSAAWGWVQPEIAPISRVCSYDRSGLGWSQGDGRYVPSGVTSELRTLLDQAHETGPFVLTGHELGAAFARLFASRYPAETAGLVLVDDPILAPQPSPSAAVVTAWPWLARIGILRAAGTMSARARGLPGSSGAAMHAFLNWPDHLTQAGREIAHAADVETAARAAQLDSSLLVTSVRTEGHQQPAMLSTPEQAAVVTRAIKEMVAQVRTHTVSATRK